MKTIFLTGATGFIGNQVLNKLREMKKYRILALTRKKANEMEGAAFVEGDIQNIPVIHDLIDQSDIVIHMAGSKKDVEMFYGTNVKGTENIVGACRKKNSLEKMIFLSSVGVIGASSNRVVDENTECRPQNEYEKSKYQAEIIVKKYSAENPGKVVILRPTNVFGENDPDRHLLNLIRKIKKRRFYFVGKNISDNYLNYLYVKEIGELVPRLLQEKTPHDLYILNTPVSLPVFITKIKNRLEDRTRSKHLPYFAVKLAVGCVGWLPPRIQAYFPVNSLKLAEITNRRIYSSSLLKKDLNWEPAHKIEEALDRLISHYEQNKLL